VKLQETALVTHDNARLAILKQYEMVQSLQELIVVLASGLGARAHRPPTSQFHGDHRSGDFMAANT